MAVPSGAKRSDQAWVQALRGDLGPAQQARAYQELGPILQDRLYNHLLRLRNEHGVARSDSNLLETARDLAQDSLQKIFEKRLYEQFEGRNGAQFTTFMSIIAIREAIDFIRRDWKQQLLSLYGDAVNEEQAEWEAPFIHELDRNSPTTSHELQELWADLQRCVAALDQQRQYVFIWLADQELGVQEVAQRLAKSKNAIYQLFFHAKADVKVCLEAKGWEMASIGRLYAAR